MKIHKTAALLACFVFCLLHATAQSTTALLRSPDYNKPKRFADLPEKQFLNVQELESLFHLAPGATVSLPVAKQFLLHGTVVSVSPPSDKNVQSVVIKSSNRAGTAFTFTRITENDGSFSYSGRMLGRETGDALEIIKEGGRYVLRKRGINEMISE